MTNLQRSASSLLATALWLSLLAAFIYSCKKNADSGSSPATPDPNLIPLKRGNTWHYKWYLHNNGRGDSLSYPETVSDSSLIGGKKFYTVGSYRLRNVDSNFIECVLPTGEIRPFFKRVSVDSTIVYQDTIMPADTTQRKLVAYTPRYTVLGHVCIKNELITVQGGQTIEKKVYYIEPGAGIIRREFYYGDNTLVDRFDLVSQTLH